jgi:PAS domain S-box-containing protein
MWHWLRRLIAAPVFPDKELNRAARWLNFLLLTLIVLIAGDTLAILLGLLDQDSLAPILLTNLIALVISLSALVLMRRGYVQIAVVIVLAVVFASITYTNAMVFQSIRTPNILSYFTLIPLAGLLLGRRAMNILATICVAAIALIFFLEWQGFLVPMPGSRSIFDDLAVVIFTITLNTVFLNATIWRVEEKAEEIRQSALALEGANRQLSVSQMQLQEAHAALESRVQQRTEELRQSNLQLQAEILERQHVVDALRKSEANWRSLATNVPEIIAMIDQERHITFVNRAFGSRAPESFFGAEAALLHRQPKYQAMLTESMDHVYATGVTVSYESEEENELEHTWRINRVGAIKEDGRVTSLILISTDITEQKQTEAAMFQTQKLESLGVLAGGVAHDFNNLLTAMLMQLSFALTKLPPNHPVGHHVQRTIAAAERAADLTRQMLNYTGRNRSEVEPLDLNELINDNIHLFSAAIPKHVELIPVLSSLIPRMKGDKGQIQQLIMNLILNAADAIGQQVGAITILTEMQDLNGDEHYFWQWTGSQLARGRYVRLEVRDTGSGMDAKTLKKIFDPFFTTKFTGRGLGLASVLGIIRSHQGGLHVTSTVGVGTTFTLLFPPLDESLYLPAKSAPSVSTHLGDGLVLVVDDEGVVREAMVEILSAAGLAVLEAENGQKGIGLFRQHEQELRLVLLDLSMPEMSGEQVFYELRALNPTIPVLLVSGYSEHEVLDRFVNTGLTGFIQKPFTRESLLQQIEPHLQSGGALAAPAPHSNGSH